MLLLFFLSALEDDYSLQVTLVNYQYQKEIMKISTVHLPKN